MSPNRLEDRLRRRLASELEGLEPSPPEFVPTPSHTKVSGIAVFAVVGVFLAMVSLPMALRVQIQGEPSISALATPPEAVRSVLSTDAIPSLDARPTVEPAIDATWSHAVSASGSASPKGWTSTHWGTIFDFERVTAQFGWAQTDDGLRVTVDGGQTWRDANPPGIGDVEPNWHVAFANESIGFAIGPDRAGNVAIWRTADGAATWQRSSVFGDFDAKGPDPEPHVAFGSNGTVEISIYASGGFRRFVSEDLGNHWAAVGRVPPGYIVGSGWATSTSDTLLYVAPDFSNTGQTAIIGISRDDGRSWSSSSLAEVPNCGTGMWPHQLGMFSATFGLLSVSCDESAGRLIVYTTDDAGAHWVPASKQEWGSQIVDVAYFSPTTWLVASEDVSASLSLSIHETSDGGATWTDHELTMDARSVGPTSFITPLQGWVQVAVDSSNANGREDQLLATGDGGETWTRITGR
jgi:photosystem II stability/assembly factor-like uncharacterized protein